MNSCCDKGKRRAETLSFDYRRQRQLEIKVMRILNGYGPRMHSQDSRVASNFAVQALERHDTTVQRDGLRHGVSATSMVLMRNSRDTIAYFSKLLND